MFPGRLQFPAIMMVGSGGAFVGRHRERRELADQWDQVVSGRRRAVFIGGEPGAGKTRLAGEVAKACFDDGAIVLAGSNTRDFGYPLQPFVEMLDRLFAQPSSAAIVTDLAADPLANLALLSPQLARHADVESATLSSFEDSGELFRAVAELVALLTREGPLVMVLENLHWAGPHTRQLLRALVAASADQRLLIVGTHRTTAPDRSDELTRSIAELYAMPGVSRIDLAGLDADEIAEYVSTASGVTGSVARRAGALLRDHTGGNPFFLEETWRDLERTGGIDALIAGRLPTPRTVRDVLDLRLAGVASNTLTVLGPAAIAGDELDLELLYDVGLDPAKVLTAIDDAVAHGLVVETGSGLSFRHALSRQAAMDRISRHKRMEVNAALAVALETRGRRTPEAIAAIAHHFTEAAPLGYAAKAVEYLVLSAEASRRSLAHREAASLFDRAAALSDGRDAVDLRFEAADSLIHAGELASAAQRFQELVGTDDPASRGRAAIGYEDTTWQTGADPTESITLLLDSMQVLPHGGASHIMASASLGRALVMSGAIDEGWRLTDHAIALARESGSLEVLGHALMTSISAHARPDDLQLHSRRAAELAAIARHTKNPLHKAMAEGGAVNAAYRLGQDNALHEHAPLVAQIVTAIGLPFVGLSGGCMQFSMAYVDGRFVEARAIADRLLAAGELLSRDNAHGVHGMQAFVLERATGRLRTMPRTLVDGARAAGTWKPGLLALVTELAMRDEATELIGPVVGIAEQLDPVSAQWAAIAVFAVEAIALVGSRDAARRMRELLAPFSGTNLMAGHLLVPLGSANRYLALVDHVLGDMDSATTNFEIALDMDRRMHAVVHEAETLLSFAAHLDSIGDHVRAQELRGQGRAIAERIGLRRRIPLEGVTHLVVDVADDHGLSPREIDVLRLLAAGMSNREIGDQLMISANTAANHVRSILMKTGTINRTQAAVYAANSGLLRG
jgi:DNA-binding CsgD family transcriptional regulator